MSKQKWNMEGGDQDGGIQVKCTTQEIGIWKQWQQCSIFVSLAQGPRESGRISSWTVLESAAKLISDAGIVQSFSAKGLGRPFFIFTPGTSMEAISRAHCLQLLRRQLALKLFCPSKWLLAKLLEIPAKPTWWFQVVVESGWQVSERRFATSLERKLFRRYVSHRSTSK